MEKKTEVFPDAVALEIVRFLRTHSFDKARAMLLRWYPPFETEYSELKSNFVSESRLSFGDRFELVDLKKISSVSTVGEARSLFKRVMKKVALFEARWKVQIAKRSLLYGEMDEDVNSKEDFKVFFNLEAMVPMNIRYLAAEVAQREMTSYLAAKQYQASHPHHFPDALHFKRPKRIGKNWVAVFINRNASDDEILKEIKNIKPPPASNKPRGNRGRPEGVPSFDIKTFEAIISKFDSTIAEIKSARNTKDTGHVRSHILFLDPKFVHVIPNGKPGRPRKSQPK